MNLKILGLAALLLMTGCNRVVVHGKDRPVEPLTRSFAHSTEATFEAAKKALLSLGYEIRESDDKAGTLRTAWASTRAGSHYTELFDRKDPGTVGSYYRVDLKVKELSPGHSEVQISLPVKSLVAHQKTTYHEERRVMRKIADLLRPDEFEMTNVGVE